MGLATDDLTAVVTAIKDPATVVERDSTGRILKFLGRIAVHAPLTVGLNTSAAALQLRNQQIDVTLLFIAQQERFLIDAGVTLPEIRQLRTRLVNAMLNIACTGPGLRENEEVVLAAVRQFPFCIRRTKRRFGNFEWDSSAGPTILFTTTASH